MVLGYRMPQTVALCFLLLYSLLSGLAYSLGNLENNCMYLVVLAMLLGVYINVTLVLQCRHMVVPCFMYILALILLNSTNVSLQQISNCGTRWR